MHTLMYTLLDPLLNPLVVWNIKRLVLKLLLLPVSAVMNIIGWFIDTYGD